MVSVPAGGVNLTVVPLVAVAVPPNPEKQVQETLLESINILKNKENKYVFLYIVCYHVIRILDRVSGLNWCHNCEVQISIILHSNMCLVMPQDFYVHSLTNLFNQTPSEFLREAFRKDAIT